MPESFEREMDRFLRGDLTPAEARALALAALDHRGLFEELTLASVALQGIAGEPAEALESYVSGRVSPTAQRELAQAALSDEELFNALAAHGAVEKSLDQPGFQVAIAGQAPEQHKVLSFPSRLRIAAMGAIAAAIALLAVYIWKPTARSTNTSRPVLTASLDPTAGKPTLLARDLAPSASNSVAPVFRSTEPDSRAPQPEGSILATDNFTINVNLGSLDGLTKGSAVDIFHGASKQPVAQAEVTTVFRDRSRAFLKSRAAIQLNDRVRPALPVYLGAVLDQMNSLAGRGDTQPARKIARDALAWAKSNGIAASQTRNILARLAPLDFHAGDVNGAEQDYQSLTDSFASPPPATVAEQDAAYNAWGSLLLLRGDTSQAAGKFRQTHDASGLNNAAVLAELRGETANAQALYEAALRNLDKSASPYDRQAIESNLSRIVKANETTRKKK